MSLEKNINNQKNAEFCNVISGINITNLSSSFPSQIIQGTTKAGIVQVQSEEEMKNLFDFLKGDQTITPPPDIMTPPSRKRKGVETIVNVPSGLASTQRKIDELEPVSKKLFVGGKTTTNRKTRKSRPTELKVLFKYLKN